MSGPVRVLAFAGSARKGSFNRRLARAAAQAAREAGGEVTLLELGDYPMPLYHGDLEAEAGMPEKALALREVFLSHEALLIATPEYNQSVPPLLKNTLDWLSRSLGDGKGPNSGLAPYRGKLAGLLAASPGPFGGTRCLPHLRQILSSLGVTVLGAQVAIPRAGEAFAEDGSLRDPAHAKAVATLARGLVQTAAKLREAPDPPRIGQDR